MTTDKRDEKIQGYLKDKFKGTPLVKVVTDILKAEPTKIFRLPDVVSEMFSDDVSKVNLIKARNRVANILSTGARNGDWYRAPEGDGYIFSR